MSSTSSSSCLNDSPTDFSNFNENYTDLLFERREEKEAVIYILNPQLGVLYEFYPAKNKLLKLPNLLLKHSPTDSFIVKIKSKLYVTGGVEKENIGSVIEVYDQESKQWSVFMDIIENLNSVQNTECLHLTKNFFKLKMSCV